MCDAASSSSARLRANLCSLSLRSATLRGRGARGQSEQRLRRHATGKHAKAAPPSHPHAAPLRHSTTPPPKTDNTTPRRRASQPRAPADEPPEVIDHERRREAVRREEMDVGAPPAELGVALAVPAGAAGAAGRGGARGGGWVAGAFGGAAGGRSGRGEEEPLLARGGRGSPDGDAGEVVGAGGEALRERRGRELQPLALGEEEDEPAGPGGVDGKLEEERGLPAAGGGAGGTGARDGAGGRAGVM